MQIGGSIQTGDFSAKPKTIHGEIKKYRDVEDDQNEEPQGFHLMYDKRIARGNTYAAITLSNRNVDPLLRDKQPGFAQKKREMVRIQTETEKKVWGEDLSTPTAVQGRRHFQMQTDKYVEQITEKQQDFHEEIQTDFFIDRPVDRLFVPVKDGIDEETQILPNELFDFTEEVEPILSVIVSKTLLQSRMEVLEEEELDTMKKQKKQFEQKINATKAEVQRLEAFEQRQTEEIDRRRLQYIKQREQKIFLQQKLLSRNMSKQLFKNMKSQTYQYFSDAGFFRYPLETLLYNDFMPWLFDEIHQVLQEDAQIDHQIKKFGQDKEKENKKEHLNALQGRVDRIEQRRLDEIRKKEEKIERRKQRELERLRQQEENRRTALRGQIQERILPKAIQKTPFQAEMVSDMFGAEEELFVGLFGGVLQQIALFLKLILELSAHQEFEVLKQIFEDNDKFIENLKTFLIKALNELAQQGGRITIFIKDTIDQEFQQISETLTTENMFQVDQETLPQVQEILGRNITTFLEFFGIDENFSSSMYEKIVKQFVQLAFSNLPLANKLKFKKINMDKNQFEDIAGFIKFQPTLEYEEQPQQQQQQLQSSQHSQPGDQLLNSQLLLPDQNEPQDQQIEEPPLTEEEILAQKLQEKEQDLITNYGHLRATAYENKVTVLPMKDEQENLRFFIQHPVVQMLLTKNWLQYICEICIKPKEKEEEKDAKDAKDPKTGKDKKVGKLKKKDPKVPLKIAQQVFRLPQDLEKRLLALIYYTMEKAEAQCLLDIFQDKLPVFKFEQY
eukprot:TRINITY_DN5225_c0_g1_i4.p1 TRINITY_DN5225_c0_g1~~TRINITY_DN5225_c0_g1_i4.p1  ORF type:complete len:785 (-),score=152.18 TRINITY_DN5225_c0_g1_i4:68-2422(-)